VAAPDPRQAENLLLLDMHHELLRQHDYEAAEDVMDLMTSAVAIEELLAAVEREDAEATAFHATLVLRSLDVGRQRGDVDGDRPQATRQS
jgi:hypothetical protein